MEYNKETIKNFIELLSSTNSMPGGGVGVALVGAIATSLTLKVCNLSIGKERYKENEEMIKSVAKELELLKTNFLELMDKDAEDFKYMEIVYKMPKSTDDEKLKRNSEMLIASKKCCEAPTLVIINLKKLIRLIDMLDGKSNVSAHSDLVIAKILSESSIKSSYENLNINFANIADESFKNSIREKLL